jgi:hypothetical protein
MSRRYRPPAILRVGPTLPDPGEIRFATVTILVIGGIAIAILGAVATPYGGGYVLLAVGAGFFTLLGIGFAGWLEYIKAKAGQP